MKNLKNNKINKAIKKDKDKTIEMKMSETVDAQKFKNKKGCFIAIILQESKDAMVTYVPSFLPFFNVANNTYMNMAQGKYLNDRMHISVYLEGVMLPIDHSFIQYESVYTLYYNDEGQPVKEIDQVPEKDIKKLLRDSDGSFIVNTEGYFVEEVSEQIKGFDFDSKTSHVVFESNLTDRMSVDRGSKALPVITVISLLLLLLMLINIGVSYMYQ